MVSIIRSFHEGMHAEVRIGEAVTNSFEVCNGVTQDRTMAPTLFNIYFSAMVTIWRDQCDDAGVTLLFKHGRKLLGIALSILDY